MRSRRLLGAPPFVQLLLYFVVAFVLSYLIEQHDASERRSLKLDELARVAEMLSDRLGYDPAATDVGHVADVLRTYERHIGYRYTLVGPDGLAILDSRFRAKYVGDLSDRPDVAAALGGQAEPHVRTYYDTDRGLLSAAAPLPTRTGPGRAVRVVASAASVGIVFGDVLMRATILSLAAWGVTALCLHATSRRLADDLGDLENGVRAFGQGRLSARIPPPGSEELDNLVELLNTMAERLDRERAQMAERQSELDAVLAGMVEGVIAVDLDDRLLAANPAAERFVSFDSDRCLGLPLQGVARNSELNRMLEQVREKGGPVYGEVVLREGQEERTLEVTASPLRDQQGYLMGTLIVLHDITQIRKLERVRRDFVANVSHELKTPVSTIRGAVETLLSGAADKPQSRERFLAMIDRSAARLSAIIEDLLSLARLEETGGGGVPLKLQPLLPCLKEAILDTAPLADASQVTVRLSCPENLAAPINPPLLVQAVVNLLDNAIRHSPSGEAVDLEAEAVGNDVEIRVRDRGPGIEERHLPRLFERFYRVDVARSRKEGGTGLGLSIVKHVAQVHRGRVGAESVLGQGSTFTVRIPSGGGG
ncbi:MAG: PAS domain-containing protein [Fimbriimonadia bacterium]|jgi:two-component system phosphate regulon sensor histidine kinase PhoR